MARIRTIKPEFFTSEDIVSLSPLARIFYIALWCEADREGRLNWRPGTLKLRYLPADACDITALAKELIDRGLIVLYTVEGKEYAEVVSFTRHQVINNRESESVIPTRQARVKHASARVQGEGKGKEGKEQEDAFARFWEAWPKNERKQDKAKCAEKFKPHAHLIETILADIETKKRTEKWRGGYVEAPEVYINNRRWEDGVTPVATPVTTASTEADRTAEYLRSQAMTPEKREAANEARELAMAAIKIVRTA